MLGARLTILATLLSAGTAQAAFYIPPRDAPGATMLPVALKCPDENRGVLEVISQNARGSTERVDVMFDAGKPSKLLVSYAFLGEFGTPDVFDLAAESEKDGADADTADSFEIASYALDLSEQVCRASPDERQRAYLSLEANRAILSEGE